MKRAKAKYQIVHDDDDDDDDDDDVYDDWHLRFVIMSSKLE